MSVAAVAYNQILTLQGKTAKRLPTLSTGHLDVVDGQLAQTHADMDPPTRTLAARHGNRGRIHQP